MSAKGSNFWRSSFGGTILLIFFQKDSLSPSMSAAVSVESDTRSAGARCECLVLQGALIRRDVSTALDPTIPCGNINIDFWVGGAVNANDILGNVAKMAVATNRIFIVLGDVLLYSRSDYRTRSKHC
jgi:hypothetical protein